MIKLSGLLFAALLAAACAPAAPSPAPAQPVSAFAPEAAAPTSATPQPKRGGIVVYPRADNMQTLHPGKGDVTIAGALSGVYEPLLRMDHQEGLDFRRARDLKPGLAERWETVDPTTFVFHLRKNVKWHDGRPMTADDVVFSLRTWTNAEEAPEPRRSAGALIASVEKVDDYTVKATTKQQSANFLPFLAFQRNVYIAPRHVEDLAKTVIGTGPFKVVKADIKSLVTVERNADFYRSGMPYLDGGKVFIGMERSQQQAALVAKAIDLMNVGDQAQYDALKKQLPADVKSTSYLQTLGNSIYMRLDKPPFNDIRVRKAMHLAIDRQGLVKSVTFGAGAINPPAGLALNSYSMSAEELQRLPGWRQPKDQDLAEAKRLLAEAGYPDGFKVGIQTAKDRTSSVPILEAAGPQLKAVGIDAQVMLLERTVFLANQRDGNYEAILDTIHADPVIQSLLAFYHSKGNLNKAPINDPDLDALIEEIDKSLDMKRADQLSRRVQEMVLEKLYTIPTVELPSFAFWQPWLNNYNLSYSAQPYIPLWDDVWMDTEKAPARTLQ